MACDLLAWLRLLCLTGELATTEPKTVRYRLLHVAAGWSAANANARSASRWHGPGPTNSATPSAPH
jgi:hypothetical protein